MLSPGQLVEAMDGSFAGNVTNDDKDKSVIRGGEFNSTISDSFLERAIVTHLSENDSDELKSPARSEAAEHQDRNIFQNDEVCQDNRNNSDEKKEEKKGSWRPPRRRDLFTFRRPITETKENS